MKRTAAYRFTSDICFYYAIISIIPSMLPLQRQMALFTAASLVVSLAALYIPWAPLRFVLALLPGFAFLHGSLGFPLVFAALAWLYLILVLTAGRFHIWLEGYRRSYRIMLWICLFSMVSCILLNLIKPDLLCILPGMYYVLAFLCLGVLAMRRLQMNAEISLRWSLANGAVEIGIPLLAAGVSLLLWRLVLLLKPVARSLIPGIRGLIAWLINVLFPINPDVPEPTPTPSPTRMPAEDAISEPVWERPDPQIDFEFKLDPALLERTQRIVICVLLLLLVIAVVLLFLRLARRNRSKAEQEGAAYEGTAEGNLVRKQKKAKSVSGSSRARQIRIIYRKYMQLMRKRGMLIRKDTTSRDILEETEQTSLSPAARRLRELYLTARYNDGAGLSSDDVQEASLCLREIQEEDPWKT